MRRAPKSRPPTGYSCMFWQKCRTHLTDGCLLQLASLCYTLSLWFQSFFVVSYTREPLYNLDRLNFTLITQFWPCLLDFVCILLLRSNPSIGISTEQWCLRTEWSGWCGRKRDGNRSRDAVDHFVSPQRERTMWLQWVMNSWCIEYVQPPAY